VNQQKLQDELDTIEEKLLSIGGYLEMLRKSGAVMPMFACECGDQCDNAGEALEATLHVKRLLDLHSDLKLT